LRFKIPLLIATFVLIILVAFWHFNVYKDNEHPVDDPGLEHSSSQSGNSRHFRIDHPARPKSQIQPRQTSQPVSPIQNNDQGRNVSDSTDISDGTLNSALVSNAMKIVIQLEHSSSINSLAFSTDGKHALSGGMGGSIMLWEISSGREIRSLKGHSEQVNSLAFSPDGKRALSGSKDSNIKLWDLSSGREIRSFKGHSVGVTSVAFSPDGRYALSGGNNRTLKLWDLSSGRELHSFRFWGHFSPGESTISPDGKYALSGGWEGILKLWDLSSGREIRSFRGSPFSISSIAFSPDGKYALSGRYDEALTLWDLSSGRKICSFKGHSSPVNSVAFSPDGRYALSGSHRTLKLWDISSGREIRTFKGALPYVNSIAFSPGGKYALSVDKEGIKLWEVSSGRKIRSFKGHSQNVNSIAFSPDGKYALSGGKGGIKLWEISSGREIRSFQGDSKWVSSIAFSPDGKYALSGGKGGIKLWEISSGREIRSFQGDSKWVSPVAFSPDGKYVLSGVKGVIKLWEISSGREIRSFQGDSKWVSSVAFSPDGKYVLSVSGGNTIKLWKIQTGKLLARMVSSPDGEWIISTPDGYYNNSPEGTHLLHMVPTVGMETYSFDQFESYFKRPDIIKARLAGDLNAGKPAPQMTKPPTIEMKDHMAFKETNSETYLLKLNTSAPKEVKTVRIFVNGRPVKEVKVNAKAKNLSLDIPLFSGANRITAVAYDEKGFSSNPGYLDVICKSQDVIKPDLYVLAVGISDYPHLSSMCQLDYAHRDAQALVKTFKKQVGKLYGQVRFNLLTNKRANLNAIKAALDALGGMKKDDVAVIFMAGQGVRAKDGTFYFLTQDGSFEEPEKGGLNWSVLNRYLSRIKGRVIIFLDAPHSGSIATETVVPNDELAQQFFSGDRGGVLLFSSSKGRQSSFESKEIGGGFGVFTYALTKSLDPKSMEADTNHNGFVEFTELVDAVSVYVHKKTEGQQTPWLSRKELFGDLPVAAVNYQGRNLLGTSDISDGKPSSGPVSKEMQPLVQLGHSSYVNSVAFSPDGKYALSGSNDNTLKLWDISSGREIRTFKGHSSYVNSVAFSPDGKYALSGSMSMDKNLKLWEISSGREIRTFKGHSLYILSVAYSPDGKYALSGGVDNTLKLWEISSGCEIRTFKGHSSEVTSVAFSPDGKYALSGSDDNTLKLWDISSGREIRTLKGHSDNVNSVAFSPDGKYTLSGSKDRTIKLWEISSGREIRSFNLHSGYVKAVAFSPDGGYAISGSDDRYFGKHFTEPTTTLKLWDISSGRETCSFEGHSGWVTSVAFSPDGKYILSGSSDNTLKLWGEISSGREIRSFEGHSDDVRSVAFSLDGKYALYGNSEVSKLWEISSGRVIRVFRGRVLFANSTTFGPDGKYVLSGGWGKTSLWEISSGHEIRSFKGHSSFVRSVAFSPNGELALSGGDDQTMKLWDISSGREIRSFKGHSGDFKTVAFSPNGELALSGGEDSTLKLWEISSGREIRTFKGHSDDVNSIAFSPDGKYALSGSNDRTLRLWEILSGYEIRLFKGHSSSVDSVAFSPDGKYALSGSADNTLKLCEISSGREIRSFEGHSGWVTSVAFSSDGKYILSGSNDNTLKLWDIETGGLIAQMVSSPDGEWIISTPDGYYNNTPEGTNLIHMVPTVGLDTYSFNQFESFFKRPDIIKARLSGDLNAGKPAPEMTKPPNIEIQDHMAVKKTDSRNYSLKLNASAVKEVKTVRVFVNGRPVIEEPVNAKAKELSLDIPLFSGGNRITAVAYDEKGFSSNPGYLDVICKNTALTKPNLYVLAIGISDYPRLPSMWQLDYAHTDARALLKTFQNQEGKLYDQVRFNLLTNESANLNAIEKALDALSGLKKDDIAVIFLAGHGVKARDGTFYFLTPAGSFEEPEKGGLSWSVLNKYLNRIKGRVIIFLDACRSGSIVTETIVPNDELAQQFFSGGQGGVMVFSASKGRQSSLESEKIGGGFGIFTYALTQSLGPKSREVDINHNGFVEFTELVDAVSDYVDKKTKGHQTPWLSRKELFGDLPLAAVNK